MAHSADAVANFFIDLATESACCDLSPMKMQKLVYFSHGWHLAITDNPLVNETIQAWRYGPVIQSLYREFKEFGDQPITRHAMNIKWDNGKVKFYQPSIGDDTSVVSLLHRVWDVYRRFTPIQLSKMTHAPGTPWHQVASQFKFVLPPGLDIPDEMIRDHFKALLEKRPTPA